MSFPVRIYQKISFLILAVICFIGTEISVSAQGGDYQIIQFSGIVLRPDSTGGVPGVHIYVPKAGRGTTTNQFGYFSLPTLAGDSIIISAVGFRKQNYIVPSDQGESITIIIPLEEDTILLPEIEIFPYPTEELLKEAILAMRLPNQAEYDAINKNLNERIMAEMFRSMPMDGSMNYKNYLNQKLTYMHDGYGPRYNPLLNPFAWAEFFKSIKRGDFDNNR